MRDGRHQNDVTGIERSARPIVERIARVYSDHLGSSLVTLVAHGSAVKGGIIPGSSDIDTVAFVRRERLTVHGELPLGIALDLHRDLARIDPAPFRYLQGQVSPAGTAPGLTFIPGTFHIVTGAPEIPTATGKTCSPPPMMRSPDSTPARSALASAMRCSTTVKAGSIARCAGRVPMSGH